MANLKVQLLGPPRIELDGEPVDINRRKALALLIYLAVSGQPHSRDALATLFYPDHSQSKARAYLRRDLAVVNTSLTGDWLDADRDTIELKQADNFYLDVAEFRQQLAACQSHEHGAEVVCQECLARLNQAATLYSDDFLAGFTLRDCPEFDDWQFFQAESLRQELALALESLVRGYRDQAEPEAAIPHARRWVAMDPLHEPAQRLLIQLYDQAGQTSAALRQYEEYAAMLEEELGLPPEEETITIYEAIKARRLLGPYLKQVEARREAKRLSGQQAQRPQIVHPLARSGPAAAESLSPGSAGEPAGDGAPRTPASVSQLEQQIHYCQTADGVQIAYSTVGAGPPLVKAANWLSHLEYDWQSPVWRHWLEGLAQHHTLIRYDERGCGLSDWDVQDFSLEAWVRDLEAVVEATGLERFPLLGISQGGPVAMAYAIRHPERVSHLILYGTLFRGRLQRELTPQQLEEAQLFLQLMRVGWGQENPAFRQVFTSMFMPEATAEQQRWFNELQRVSTSPENAVRIANTFNTIDARPLAPQVTTPTLVLHATDETEIPFSEGQLTADLIPGARLVPLASKNHILLANEPAWSQFLDEVQQFLQVGRDEQPGPAPSRRSQTIDAPAVSLPELKAPVFVARRQELGQLDRWLNAALSGQQRVVFVTGEAGQGKTALLQAFTRQAQAAHPDLIVAGGNCNAYTGQGDPYLPFREILELLSGDVEARRRAGTLEPEPARRLERILPAAVQALIDSPDLLDTFVPAQPLLQRAGQLESLQPGRFKELSELVARKTGPGDPATTAQSALFEQYAKVIQALARQAPLLLYVDDLQWADLGSTNLLFHLARRLKGHRVLIVGAYRPAEVASGRPAAASDTIERHPLARVVNEIQREFGQISLDLSRTEGRTFVDELLDNEPNRLSESFREMLYRQTGGHPLFTIELLRGMQERGELSKDQAGRWAEQPGLNWQTLPARVEGAIGERISRLTGPLQSLLQVASVEGELFTAEEVADVLGLEPQTVLRQLSQELVKTHQLVRAIEVKRVGAQRLSRYRFQHILIQRYLYHSQDEIERIHRHEAVGQALERLYDGHTDDIAPELARHFEAAALPERAATYLHQAGDQARRSAALHEAAQYYRAALQRWPAQDQAGRAHLLRQLGECQWMLGQLQDALSSLETSYALQRTLNNAQAAGAAQLVIARLFWELGQRDESLRHLHQALAILEELPKSVELAQAFSAMAQMHMLAAEYDQAIPWGERALELANRLGADAVKAHTMTNLGDVYYYTGDQKRGLALIRDGLQLALSLGLPHDVCRAYLILGESLASDGRYADAQTSFSDLEAYAARVGASMFAGIAVVETTKILWVTGNWQAALSNYQQILDWERQGQSLSYLQVITGNLFGQIYNDLGQADRAGQALQETLPQAKGQDELQALGPHLAQSARALAAWGQNSDVRAHLHRLLSLIHRHQYDHVTSIMPLLFSCRWFATRTADSDEPLDDPQTSLSLLERLYNQTKGAVARAARDEARGVVALAGGDDEAALTHYRNASGGWQQLGHPYDQARALYGLALALSRRGQVDDAREALDRAISILDALAAQLEEPELRLAFLNAPLRQQIRQTRAGLGASLAPTLPNIDQLSRHNLPAQITEFIGRKEELTSIRRRLVEEPIARLVTLVGPGGIGKTRLALEAATRMLADFSDGVYFVPLAPLTSAGPMVVTVAQHLDFLFYEGGDLKQQLLDHLSRKHLLLVLDNFEHVLAGATLVAEILQAAPGVKILVTSRERLNLSSETVYLLSGLEIPEANGPKLKDTLEFDAARLFLQQARLVRPNFEPRAEERAEIQQICRLTQGMPLALVLAAGWLEMLSVREIGLELRQSLDILETEMHDVPERQRSMRAVFNYSWARLAPDIQQMFVRLSVFRGGFTRQAAKTVAGADLKGLRTLVNKSLLIRPEEDRYEIHELLRQYGEEHLAAGGEADVIRDAHRDYFLTMLYEREDDLQGRRQLPALKEIEVDLENIKVAWLRAVQQLQEARLDRSLESLWLYFYIRSRFQAGAQLISQTCEALEATTGKAGKLLWGRLLVRLSHMQIDAPALRRGEIETQVKQSLAIAQAYDHPLETAISLMMFGMYYAYANPDYAQAKAYFEQSLDILRGLDEPYYLALTLHRLGYCYANLGQLDRWQQDTLECMAVAEKTGNLAELALAKSNLIVAEIIAGRYSEAESLCHEIITLGEKVRMPLTLAHAKAELGLTHFLLGNFGRARRIAAEALDISRDLNWAIHIALSTAALGLVENGLGRYDAAKKWAEDSLATDSRNPWAIFQANLVLAVAYCGLEDDEAAWQCINTVYANIVRPMPPALILWPLPAAVVLLARRQQHEQAVELLALSLTHPLSPTGWQEAWPLLSDWRARLEQALAPEAYQAAWERGQALDLERVVDRLTGHLPDKPVSLSETAAEAAGQRFVEETLLTTGGMGQVYLGRDTGTGQPVAIKRLRPELVNNNPEVAKRFRREAEALRRLDHPNIVKILDSFEQEGQPVIVMEYVPGGSLQELLKKEPRLPLAPVLSLGLELADALARVHHLGILHRDIKPGNVLLAEDGAPRLTDFGVAYLARQETQLTQEGAILGTSAYLSPEAWRGEALDERSDIWSFGALLYELLAGRQPFEAPQVVAIMTRILHEPPPDLSDLRPDAPPALVALIGQMLAKERSQRPASMRQVAAALESIREGVL